MHGALLSTYDVVAPRKKLTRKHTGTEPRTHADAASRVSVLVAERPFRFRRRPVLRLFGTNDLKNSAESALKFCSCSTVSCLVDRAVVVAKIHKLLTRPVWGLGKARMFASAFGLGIDRRVKTTLVHSLLQNIHLSVVVTMQKESTMEGRITSRQCPL